MQLLKSCGFYMRRGNVFRVNRDISCDVVERREKKESERGKVM